MTMWDTVAAERGALADDLAGLADNDWATPSLCEDWSVREALAHMTGTAQTTPLGFFGGLIGSKFNFGAFIDKQIRRNLGETPADTLANFRAMQHATDAPPGPKLSWLGETIVHAEDIRRPLGISHDYPTDAVIQVAGFYKNSNTLIGSKSRIAGVQLKATDADWSHGVGELVEGPMVSLLLAMTGRKQALDDLTGPGTETLRQRD